MNFIQHLNKYKNIYLILPIIIFYWLLCIQLIEILVRNEKDKKVKKNKRKIYMLIISLISLIYGIILYKKCSNEALPVSGGIFIGSSMMILHYIYSSWNMFHDIIKLIIFSCLLLSVIYGTNKLIHHFPMDLFDL